jgi:hypothetical protein
MHAEQTRHGHPLGTEITKCPACHQGLLFFVDCIGGKSMVLECAHCRKRWYKNCDCELFELDEEGQIAETKQPN